MPEIIVKTKRLLIRELNENDFDVVVPLIKEGELISKYLDDPEILELFLKKSWKEIRKPDIFNGLIFLLNSNEFCGRICMQNINDSVPEIGIDILNKHKNNGYAPESIAAFANWYGEKHSIKLAKVRIWKNNTHSIHVFEKLGAKFEGQHPYFSDEILEMLREKLPDLKKKLPDSDFSKFEANAPLTYYLKLPIITS